MHAVTPFSTLIFNCERVNWSMTGNKIEDPLIDAIRSSILIYEWTLAPSSDHWY